MSTQICLYIAIVLDCSALLQLSRLSLLILLPQGNFCKMLYDHLISCHRPSSAPIQSCARCFVSFGYSDLNCAAKVGAILEIDRDRWFRLRIYCHQPCFSLATNVGVSIIAVHILNQGRPQSGPVNQSQAHVRLINCFLACEFMP